MILINLLPHREERRKRRKQAFFAGLAAAAGLGLGIVAIWYLVLQQMISAQQDRNAFLKSEIARLEVQIKDIATLRAEIDALKARQKVVEDFQTDRNMPVHLLNELVAQTPEGLYLSSVRQDGQSVTVGGIAQSNERVSELLRNVGNNSDWLSRPELVEIKSTTLTLASREQKRLFEFSMRLALKRAQDQKPAAPAAGASGPAMPVTAAPAAASKS
jgi:type IV pilus assembly protein PilN